MSVTGSDARPDPG